MKDYKKYAKDAKNRLKNGYWSNFKKIRQEEIDSMLNAGRDYATANNIIKNNLNRKFYPEKNNAYDEELYKKVCKIVDSKAYELNPIQELMDKEYYSSLNEEERQRYILNLSNQYKTYKKIYCDNKNNLR